MTGTEYQNAAMRTCRFNKRGELNVVKMLDHATHGLASEAGEVAGIMQKTSQGHVFDNNHMLKELGDCMWMIAEICEALGHTVDDVMEINIKKLWERYPNGFEIERSINRSEEDI